MITRAENEHPDQWRNQGCLEGYCISKESEQFWFKPVFGLKPVSGFWFLVSGFKPVSGVPEQFWF
jgi:hypothetical protein